MTSDRAAGPSWRGFTFRGFTFLELLATMGVITVLAALLFPVYLRSRESARRAACGSNVLQLVQGLHLYAQDNDGRFPNDERRWFPPVQPYVKNFVVLQCPSDPEVVKHNRSALPAGSPSAPDLNSYRYHPGLANDDWDDLPLVWDRRRNHTEGGNVGCLGGNVLWLETARLPHSVPAAGAAATGGAP